MKGLVSTTEMLEVPYGDTYINLTLPTTFGNSDQDEEAIGLIKERYIRDLQVIGQAKSRLFLRETRAGNSVDVEAKGLEQHTYIVSEHPEIDKPDLDVTDRGIQWKPNKDDLPRILSVYLSYLEHKGLHLRSFNGVYLTQDQSVKDYKTALLDAGIPPELLDGREDIWQDLREFQKDLTISHNLNYNLFSLEGKKWRLKVYNTRDARSKAKAKIAAAAHYYLSERLSNDHLIVKSESPEPIEVNGVYMVLQELKDGPNV
ncbi:hypothetical protein HYT52_04640 [Candidatus Woesearchaeota archaeon]|nr:hypothetical protein [Candidatus Woesearchaeota archaeon]